MKQFLFWAALSLAACKKSESQKDPPSETVEIESRVLTEQLNFPWEILWGPDNFIWMTERGGKISRVNPATGNVTTLLTETNVRTSGEGGLLGMVLHPNFNTSPYVYAVYNYSEGNGYKERVVRYTWQNNTLGNSITLLDNIAGESIHDGSRLLISPDGKLLITTGDAANTSLPQNNAALNGKVLRINLDGSIPADNPIPGNPMWCKGLRNSQGLVFAHNVLYGSEHGPDSDDELNIIEKGANYGWPNVRGFCDAGETAFCTDHNVKEPIKAWTPTLAVCGLDYYDNDLLPQWKNSLLLCTLKGNKLLQLQLNDAHNGVTATNEYFVRSYGRLRDICVAPNGKVYVCTSNGGSTDKIIEIFRKQP